MTWTSATAGRASPPRGRRISMTPGMHSMICTRRWRSSAPGNSPWRIISLRACALRLLADTAQGGVIASLAREGGISSTLWAGPESFSAAVKRGDQQVHGTKRQEPVTLRLGFQSDEFSYAIDLGLPRAEQLGLRQRSRNQDRMHMAWRAVTSLVNAGRAPRTGRPRPPRWR